MNIANMLKDRVRLQLRVATMGATGETVTWVPVETRWARVVAIDVRAQAAYQQMETTVTHKVIFRGPVDIDLGKHRFLWGDMTLIPMTSSQESKGYTTVMVKGD